MLRKNIQTQSQCLKSRPCELWTLLFLQMGHVCPCILSQFHIKHNASIRIHFEISLTIFYHCRMHWNAMQEQRTIALKAIMSWRVPWTLFASAWTPRTWWTCRTMFSQQNSHLISRWWFSLYFLWVLAFWRVLVRRNYLWVDTWELFTARSNILYFYNLY